MSTDGISAFDRNVCGVIMPIRFNLSTDLLVRYTTVRGAISLEEMRAYAEQIVRDDSLRTQLGYVDLRELQDCLIGYAAIRDYARAAQSQAMLGDHRFYEVVFAPEDLAFGLARMYQTLVGDSFDVRVFREETDAKTALEHARGGILAMLGS